MLSFAIETGFVLIGLAMLLNLWRLLRGPDITDRILALDTLNINAIALLVLYGIREASSAYFEGALILPRWASSLPSPCANICCAETSSNEKP